MYKHTLPVVNTIRHSLTLARTIRKSSVLNMNFPDNADV